MLQVPRVVVHVLRERRARWKRAPRGGISQRGARFQRARDPVDRPRKSWRGNCRENREANNPGLQDRRAHDCGLHDRGACGGGSSVEISQGTTGVWRLRSSGLDGRKATICRRGGVRRRHSATTDDKIWASKWGRNAFVRRGCDCERRRATRRKIFAKSRLWRLVVSPQLSRPMFVHRWDGGTGLKRCCRGDRKRQIAISD